MSFSVLTSQLNAQTIIDLNIHVVLLKNYIFENMLAGLLMVLNPSEQI